MTTLSIRRNSQGRETEKVFQQNIIARILFVKSLESVYLDSSHNNHPIPGETANFNYVAQQEELEKKLSQQISKRQEAEKMTDGWKHRLINQETEFRKIVERISEQNKILKYQTHMAGGVIPGSVDKKNKEIKNLHSQIQSEILKGNEDKCSWLKTQLDHNIKYMNIKLEKIRKTMKEEVEKHRVLTSKTYDTIMQEIQYTLDLTTIIDQENQKLAKEIKDLRVNNELLMEERNMVLQQLIEKKNILKQWSNQTRYQSTSVQLYRGNKKPLLQRNNGISSTRSGGAQNMKKIVVPAKLLERSKRQLFEEKGCSTSLSKNAPAEEGRISQFNNTYNNNKPFNMQKESKNRQQKSIVLLQKTLEREKKKHFQISSMFNRTSNLAQELQDVLHQSIEQFKQELEASWGSTTTTEKSEFQQQIMDKFARAFDRVLSKINEIKELPSNGNISGSSTVRSPFYSLGSTQRNSKFLQFSIPNKEDLQKTELDCSDLLE